MCPRGLIYSCDCWSPEMRPFCQSPSGCNPETKEKNGFRRSYPNAIEIHSIPREGVLFSSLCLSLFLKPKGGGLYDWEIYSSLTQITTTDKPLRARYPRPAIYIPRRHRAETNHRDLCLESSSSLSMISGKMSNYKKTGEISLIVEKCPAAFVMDTET